MRNFWELPLPPPGIIPMSFLNKSPADDPGQKEKRNPKRNTLMVGFLP